MKRKLVTILTLCLIFFTAMSTFVACTNGNTGNGQNPPEHSHVYNKRIVNQTYLESQATCTQKARYYFSCECGDISSATFEDGEFGEHYYGDWISNGNDTHTRTCLLNINHTETKSCNGGSATCTEKAICATCNTVYGSLEEHKHLTLKYNEIEHWYECVCGDKSNVEKHIPGDLATETTNQICTECEYIITSALGHVHALHLTKVDAKPQSCTKEGNLEYYTCSCGKWFVDSSATTEIFDKESVVIEKDEHTFDVQKIEDNYKVSSATCTEKAVYNYACICGEKGTNTFKYGNPLDHAYGEWISNGNDTHTKTCVNDNTHKITENCFGGTKTCTEKAICVDCEIEYGSLESHKYDLLKYDQIEHWYECVCGDKSNIQEHEGGTATCIEKATCGECDVAYGKLGECNYVNGICTVCGDIIGTEGLQYALINNDTEYEISGYTGSSTEVYIPSIYKGLPVTSIDYAAFYACMSLTSVIISDSVTSIGESAFYNCSSLTNIIIGDGVRLIGRNTFYKCSLLISIAIGKSVTSIGESAFRDCSSLTSIIIPDGVTSIGVGVFSGCRKLANIELGKGLLSIGEDAFNSCIELANIIVPKSVISIGEGAFYNCTSLISVEIDEKNTTYKSIDGNLYSKDGKTLIHYCLGKRLNAFVIPNVVTSIGNSAFYGCRSLASIEIPNTVTDICDYAFAWCELLTSIIIPDGVMYIGEGAFDNCSRLINIKLPYSVSTIGNDAFYRCNKLTLIEIDEKNTNYQSIDGNLYSKDGKTLIQYAIGKVETSFTIPNSVTIIADNAFYNCKKLTSVIIPNNVISIGKFAFGKCNSLKNIIIPNSVKSIDYYAFEDCTSLKTIYCKAESQPSGWIYSWNYDCPAEVVWGYKG